jgi:hypothetical protein
MFCSGTDCSYATAHSIKRRKSNPDLYPGRQEQHRSHYCKVGQHVGSKGVASCNKSLLIHGYGDPYSAFTVIGLEEDLALAND